MWDNTKFYMGVKNQITVKNYTETLPLNETMYFFALSDKNGSLTFQAMTVIPLTAIVNTYTYNSAMRFIRIDCSIKKITL